MKLFSITVLLIAFAMSAATAQTKKVSNGSTDPWTFNAYPATVGYKGKPHEPELARPKELTYQTQIRDQAKRGPNFAGHYTIAKWGCGSTCIAFVIVDARFGTTFDPGLTVGCADKTGMDAKIDFKLWSRLVIVTTFEEGLGCGTGFYEWHDRGLQRLYFKPWNYGHRSRRTVQLPRYMTDIQQPVPPELKMSGAPSTARKADCFRGFTGSNSVFDVVRKCGVPGEHQGSGLFIFIYDMDDGSVVAMGTSDLKTIMYLDHMVGKTSESLLKKIVDDR